MKLFKLLKSIDDFLYFHLGILTSMRRRIYRINSRNIQRELNLEHSHRDYVNSILGCDYTTKKALTLFNNKINID